MIDIIITNYNNGDKLKRCLESVARQTLISNIRVILVDDASTDDSVEVAYSACKRLCGCDIVVVRNDENLGAGMSRRVGIHKALGFDDYEHTMFLDGDDEITPNLVEDMYRDAVMYDADLTVCKVRFVGGDNDGKIHEVGDAELISVEEYRKRELGKLCGFLNNMLIRTSLWNSLEYSSLRFIEDWPTKERLMHYVKSVAVSDAGYYLYNHNDESLCNTCTQVKHTVYTALSMIEVCDFCRSVGDTGGYESLMYPIWMCLVSLRPSMDEVLRDWFDEMDAICRWCDKNMNEYVDKDKAEKQGEVQRDEEKDGQDNRGADSQ